MASATGSDDARAAAKGPHLCGGEPEDLGDDPGADGEIGARSRKTTQPDGMAIIAAATAASGNAARAGTPANIAKANSRYPPKPT